ncbi:MAG: glycogen synthase GlgA [Lachnospiraceae bacterium]
MKNVLFVAAECVPFIKTGGLADVVGALPKAYDKRKYDVRVMIPNYLCIPKSYRDKMKDLGHFETKLSWREQYVGIKELVLDGITYYFIDNEYYFGGTAPYDNMYGDMEKFTFLCKAVLDALPVIGFQPDIMHCHDWQASLIPVYLKTLYAGHPFYEQTKSVFTIHNLRFQGICEIGRLIDISGLPSDIFYNGNMEAYGSANMLKGALVYSDKITTVSQTYAREIQTQEYGENLSELLRRRAGDLTGIVNGIDYDVFQPSKDGALSRKYTASTFKAGKKSNKKALQHKLGLPENPDAFLIGIISRLTDQKGLDLINCVMREICARDVQFVCLGTGEERYENMFRYYAVQYPERVSANICYSDELAHQIYAGLDAILMPSLFEPCGLCQLIALRYGTIPIVRETGGLADTVEAYNEYEQTGTGFSFTAYNAHDMLHVIQYAKQVYQEHRTAWDAMVKRGMQKNFSWKESAKLYQELYDKLV